MNKEIIETIKNVGSVIELKEVATRNGYHITDKEAQGYFDLYHNNGKLDENELDNITGGYCRNGRQYSSEGNYELIVTDLNTCDLFSSNSLTAITRACNDCEFYFHDYDRSAVAAYCRKRTFNDDPCNPA